jgi:uncharacterized protein
MSYIWLLEADFMKKIKIQSILLLTLFLFSFISYCQIPTDSSKTNPQKTQYNIPRPKDYVNDFERIFTIEQIEFLDSIINDFEKKTTIQIAIVSIDTTMISKDKFDDYTLQMLRTWGVGQKDKNNGILIGISLAYGRIRIQNGYGIEKILSNEETKQIIDSTFIPRYKEGKFYEGTLNGLNAIIQKLK